MDELSSTLDDLWFTEIEHRAAASDNGDGKSIPFEEAWQQITKSLTPNRVEAPNRNNRHRDGAG